MSLSFRRHYKLLVLLVLVTLVLILGAGDRAIVAYDGRIVEQVVHRAAGDVSAVGQAGDAVVGSIEAPISGAANDY